jgi:8-oxo-dGTP diphosphatase
MRREYPEAPIAGVGVLVRQGDRVLLVQRGQEPGRGKWALPGGVIELGETLGEAARRELAEECGIQATLGEMLEAVDRISRDAAGRVRYHYVIVIFRAEYAGGEVRPDSDAMAARWVTTEDLPDLDMRSSIKALVRRVLEEKPTTKHALRNEGTPRHEESKN